MAARTRKLLHDDFTRAKIKTGLLVKRLEDHVFDGVEMTKTQVSAALGLLKKSLPDLQTVAHTGENGGPIDLNVSTDAERAKALAVFLAKTMPKK